MSLPVVVLGGGGYVGAEMVRLVTQHPGLDLAAVYSRRPRARIGERHPHLAARLAGVSVLSLEELDLDQIGGPGEKVAVLSALPHGTSAEVLQGALTATTRDVHVADVAADFRFDAVSNFEEIYGVSHGAPELLSDFHCGVPDIDSSTPTRHAVQPGCFTTAVTLAAAPFVAANLVEGRIVASCITGSSGSGAEPKVGTHHPSRHGNLMAYGHLTHRHEAEMRVFLGRLGEALPDILFLPHSGPFVRGIHATVVMRLREEASIESLREKARAFHDSPFVSVLDRMPGVGEVRGSNEARLGISVRGRDVSVCCVIDNLVKGAAGGAVQWMNRLLGFDATAGLEAVPMAWS